MVAHEVYALIYDGIVKHVCRSNNYTEANWTAKCVHGNDAFAVDCMYCPCQEGDTYIDGTFYAPDGTSRPWLPTQEHRLAQLEVENQELIVALADVIGGAI